MRLDAVSSLGGTSFVTDAGAASTAARPGTG
jgi:hypothetical protein